MARAIRKPRLRQVPLSEVESDLSRFLQEAGSEDIVITKDGKPAGVLVGFASDDDWFEYQLENDPRFVARVRQARDSLGRGAGIKLEDVE